MKKKYLFLLSFFPALLTIFLPAEVKTATQAHSTSALDHRSYVYLKNNAVSPIEFSDRILAQEIADRYLKKIPLQSLVKNLTLEQALQVQEKFVQLLIPTYGQPVGYKAGLTNREVQKKFHSDRPVSGILLEKMLLPTETVLPANFATRPLIEGDLIVRVGSEKINTAKTPQEALAALDAIIPFLELPDLVYAENIQLTASEIVAINVGARLGIIGQAIPLNNRQEWQERLGKITIIIYDRYGEQLVTGKSQALLGDPLKAVLWLRDDLQARGKILKKGDLLSLGTITPAIPVKSGMSIRAQYIGLDVEKPVEISVEFE
jgi:2-keto-4-pentenoate hydratase